MNLCCFIRLKSLKSCFETYCDGRGKESGNSKHSGDLTSNIIHCLPSKWMLGNSQCPQSLLPWPYLVDQRYSPHPNHRNGTVLLMCSNSLNPHKLCKASTVNIHLLQARKQAPGSEAICPRHVSSSSSHPNRASVEDHGKPGPDRRTQR